MTDGFARDSLKPGTREQEKTRGGAAPGFLLLVNVISGSGDEPERRWRSSRCQAGAWRPAREPTPSGSGSQTSVRHTRKTPKRMEPHTGGELSSFPLESSSALAGTKAAEAATRTGRQFPSIQRCAIDEPCTRRQDALAVSLPHQLTKVRGKRLRREACVCATFCGAKGTLLPSLGLDTPSYFLGREPFD